MVNSVKILLNINLTNSPHDQLHKISHWKQFMDILSHDNQQYIPEGVCIPARRPYYCNRTFWNIKICNNLSISDAIDIVYEWGTQRCLAIHTCRFPIIHLLIRWSMTIIERKHSFFRAWALKIQGCCKSHSWINLGVLLDVLPIYLTIWNI